MRRGSARCAALATFPAAAPVVRRCDANLTRVPPADACRIRTPELPAVLRMLTAFRVPAATKHRCGPNRSRVPPADARRIRTPELPTVLRMLPAFRVPAAINHRCGPNRSLVLPAPVRRILTPALAEFPAVAPITLRDNASRAVLLAPHLRRIATLALAAFLAVLVALPAAAAITLRDDAGRDITLAAPARRIVTLAPNLAELAFAAGAGERVVAVSSASDYPPAAARLPVVGSHGRVDLERLVAMRPDLVLAWQTGNPARDLARIERLGIPVFVTEPRRLADIPRLLRAIGRLAGTEDAAERAARAFEAELHALASMKRPATVSVLFELWHDPLITVSDRHLIGDMIRLCGGRNVFGGLASLTPRVTREALLAADPDVIISSALPADRAAVLATWQDTPLLRAVREGAVVPLDPVIAHRQGPRVLEAARDLCAALDSARRR